MDWLNDDEEELIEEYMVKLLCRVWGEIEEELVELVEFVVKVSVGCDWWLENELKDVVLVN